MGSACDEGKGGRFGRKRVGERIETKFRVKAPLEKNFSVFYKSFMLALMFTNGHICFPMALWDYYLTVTDMSDSKVRQNKILLIQNAECADCCCTSEWKLGKREEIIKTFNLLAPSLSPCSSHLHFISTKTKTSVSKAVKRQLKYLLAPESDLRGLNRVDKCSLGSTRGIGSRHATKASHRVQRWAWTWARQRDPSWSGETPLKARHVIAICSVTDHVVIKRYH